MNADGRDPLAVLRDGDTPVDPDPAFAARLRARLQSALSLPTTGDLTMAGTDAALADLARTAAVVPRPAALPYLAVRGAADAIAWYADAFGATLADEPIRMPDGRIGHAELALAGGTLYLADEYPELGLSAPAPHAVSVSLVLEVDDADAALARAAAAGATVERDAADAHGARSAAVVDPFGHRWILSGPVRVVERIRPGDLGYASVWTTDPERTAAFYGRVLGWEVDRASRRVTNTVAPLGIVAMPGPPTLFCCYAVDDVEAARRAIVEAGGEAGEVQHTPHGPTVDATDPAGTAFAVFEPTGTEARPALNGAGPGELSYLTYLVADSAAFRAFYGRVLGWSFAPGRIDDGWEVRDARPMSGAAGGSDQPAAVPMWTVTDIGAAVTEVVQAGGTVLEEPSQQSYGLSALCTDDQGNRFYLGQF